MGATSVTGTGPGIARGPDGKVAQHKPENHCGCGGCGDKEDEQPCGVLRDAAAFDVQFTDAIHFFCQMAGHNFC
jgi:hypothetical protein